jgi:hypothetical protein
MISVRSRRIAASASLVIGAAQSLDSGIRHSSPASIALVAIALFGVAAVLWWSSRTRWHLIAVAIGLGLLVMARVVSPVPLPTLALAGWFPAILIFFLEVGAKTSASLLLIAVASTAPGLSVQAGHEVLFSEAAARAHVHPVAHPAARGFVQSAFGVDEVGEHSDVLRPKAWFALWRVSSCCWLPRRASWDVGSSGGNPFARICKPFSFRRLRTASISVYARTADPDSPGSAAIGLY